MVSKRLVRELKVCGMRPGVPDAQRTLQRQAAIDGIHRVWVPLSCTLRPTKHLAFKLQKNPNAGPLFGTESVKNKLTTCTSMPPHINTSRSVAVITWFGAFKVSILLRECEHV